MADENENEAKTEAASSEGEAKPSEPANSEPPQAEEKLEAKASEPPNGKEAPIAAAIAHDHGGHGGHGEDHGLAHTMPVPLLLGVLVALLGLTILTVSVTHYDLGSEGNLVVAMIIATIKAGLVVTFFMHLLWDKKFHLILFLTAILFVVLFLSMSITDRGEYQPRIDEYSTQTP